MNVLLYSGMYICIPLYMIGRLLFLLLFLCLGWVLEIPIISMGFLGYEDYLIDCVLRIIYI